MIQVNELRIGNYLCKEYAPYGYAQGSEYTKITLSDFGVIQGFKFSSFKFSPIIITLWVLEKCGATKIGECWELQAGRVTFQFFMQGKDWVISVRPDIGLDFFVLPNTCQAAEYLHHFQNLYYILTGQDLEIII